MTVAAPGRATVRSRALELWTGYGPTVAPFLGAALITCYLGFEQGGFFPGSEAVRTIALALCLIVRVVAITRPFASRGWPTGPRSARWPSSPL